MIRENQRLKDLCERKQEDLQNLQALQADKEKEYKELMAKYRDLYKFSQDDMNKMTQYTDRTTQLEEQVQ